MFILLLRQLWLPDSYFVGHGQPWSADQSQAQVFDSIAEINAAVAKMLNHNHLQLTKRLDSQVALVSPREVLKGLVFIMQKAKDQTSDEILLQFHAEENRWTWAAPSYLYRKKQHGASDGIF